MFPPAQFPALYLLGVDDAGPAALAPVRPCACFAGHPNCPNGSGRYPLFPGSPPDPRHSASDVGDPIIPSIPTRFPDAYHPPTSFTRRAST